MFCVAHLLAVPAQALRLITNVALDGAAGVTIEPGDSFMITAQVDVADGGLNSNNDWQSTGWRIANTPPGTLTCDNMVNVSHTGLGPFTDTTSFMVTAPMTPGIYDAYFVAYEDNSCAGTGLMASNVYRAGPVIVAGCGNGLIEEGEQCDDGAANGNGTSCCTSICALVPDCPFACRTKLEASLTRTGAGANESPPDTFVVTNNSAPGITIDKVVILLPANTSFDTAGIIPTTFFPFTQGAGAAATGIISPANGGVADGASSLTLTFGDFNANESFTFQIDTDFDAPVTGISIPSGAQLAGAIVMVTFRKGTATITGVGTLNDAGGLDNLAIVTSAAQFLCSAPAMSFPGLVIAGLLLAGFGYRSLRPRSPIRDSDSRAV